MSAYEIPGKRYTFVTAADLTAKRYHAVTLGAGGVNVATAAKAITGVLQTPEEAGRPAQVMVDGITFGVLGGTVAEGDLVEVGADGAFVKATSGVVVGQAVVGGDTGAIGSILLK